MTGYNELKGAGQILVVEDDPIQRRLLKSAIERQGHVVHQAENGRIGLEIVRGRIQLDAHGRELLLNGVVQFAGNAVAFFVHGFALDLPGDDLRLLPHPPAQGRDPREHRHQEHQESPTGEGEARRIPPRRGSKLLDASAAPESQCDTF